MTLTIRKIIVLGLIGAVLLIGNILFVANWLMDKGVVGWAENVRAEYLTGTAVTIMDDYSYCTSLLNCSESSLKHVLNL